MSGSSIRFKRGNKADLPKSASSGTPLWCEDTKELYIGNGDGVVKIGDIDKANSVIDQNDINTTLKYWTGTRAEYLALEEKDENTFYSIIDDNEIEVSLLERIYPIGAIYIGTMAICPLEALFGTWKFKCQGQVLQGTDEKHIAGSSVEAGLPNITADWNSAQYDGGWSANGAVYGVKNNSKEYNSGSSGMRAYFDASRSSSIYGKSDTVQPPAYLVNIWERTA